MTAIKRVLPEPINQEVPGHITVISCVYAKTYYHVGQGANSYGSASVYHHFKRGCRSEGLLTESKKANEVVILVITH